MEPPFPEASIFSTEVRSLSSAAGHDYRISVWLPPSYASTTKSYPSLYVLDANVCFGMVAEAVWSLVLGNELPELLIVGIGYPIKSLDEWVIHRSRDFTPTRMHANPGSGGAESFLSCLQTELIPFVEQNYRTEPTDRTLFGYSLGGLFTLFSLLRNPQLFRRYVAGSPVLDWDNRVMFDFEKELASNRSGLDKRCFISVGSREPSFLSHVQDFAYAMQQRSYDGFDLNLRVFDGETHASSPAFAAVKGLQTVFG